jgi:uncharacterized Zn finger protein (UPF0148 family)
VSEATCQREACHVCGSTVWRQGIFANGVITCAACAAEIRRAQEATKPNPAPKQTSIADWMRGPSRGARP